MIYRSCSGARLAASVTDRQYPRQVAVEAWRKVGDDGRELFGITLTVRSNDGEGAQLAERRHMAVSRPSACRAQCRKADIGLAHDEWPGGSSRNRITPKGATGTFFPSCPICEVSRIGFVRIVRTSLPSPRRFTRGGYGRDQNFMRNPALARRLLLSPKLDRAVLAEISENIAKRPSAQL